MSWKSIDAEKAIPWVEARTGLALADSQKTAIHAALRSKVMVITGGPGVGETTLVNSILRILAAIKVCLLLCAPTGRAAKRMTETTGYEENTIHRLLEINPKTGGFRKNEESPLDCDLLVVDETSMVDVVLMNSLLKAVADHTAVLFVGDIDQLAGRPGPGPCRYHRERRRASCDTYRGFPAGGPKPDCSERPQDQFWADARSVGSPGCNGFLFR
jgi:exodeoxyribonuclease V alpha subunit